MLKKFDALNASVQENLISIRVVKAFVRSDYEKKKFKDANDEIDGDARDVIKVYGLFISNITRLIIILSIVTLIMLLMLVNWSFTGWMKYFGTPVLLSGIIYTVLYGLATAFMYKLIEMLEITTTINLTILLVVGLGELFVGVMFIVLKSLFTKTEKLTN